MKTTNLEEMRIAMETYYEEVCAPWSVWLGGDQCWPRNLHVVEVQCSLHAEAAAA